MRDEDWELLNVIWAILLICAVALSLIWTAVHVPVGQ